MIDNDNIRWIVGIIVVVNIILSLYNSYGIIDSVNSINDITAPYMVYEEQRESIEYVLADRGYEVLSVSMGNYTTISPFLEWYNITDDTICGVNETICYTDKVYISIEMKSFGSRSEQIWDALTSSHVVFPNTLVHRITIKSPTDKCEYVIFGVSQYFETYDSEIHELIQKQIDEDGKCS